MANGEGNITIVITPEGELVEVSQDGATWAPYTVKEGESALILSRSIVTGDSAAQRICLKKANGDIVCS